MARRSLLVCAVLTAACERDQPLFEKLDPASTGISFANELPEDTSFNILNYLYYYNGGGVAAGDVNNDGLSDLFFTSNVGPDRLYLNKGGYRFEDVTERAGVAGEPGSWTTGVTMADVDADGWLDIYVSNASSPSKPGRNLLFVNNRDGTFTERARELGLDQAGYATQALFFDYDADGDLDVYLLNYSVHSERGPSARPQREYHPRAGDRLMRNEGGHFQDVSRAAGIYQGVEGYGLGVVASDFDLDGCIDLFVANDFQENDFLYYNNCDGTFAESIGTSMGHTSQFSMGTDAADFNNDLRPDLVVVDMLPDREDIRKTAASAESQELFELKSRAGYHAQYARNTLQLNRGGRRFSDVGLLAGVAATDWSWAPLFADFDNDGRKDLFITNGVYRRPNDLDYLAFVSSEASQRSLAGGVNAGTIAIVDRMPHVALAKYLFQNEGDLRFRDRAAAWGIGDAGFSNGAVYVDLNNSGALDLVVNNLNAPAAIYRNHARARNGNHFVRVDLEGAGGNTRGVGAKVVVFSGGTAQLVEQIPTRGFQSSVDPRIHVGLGAATRVDSLLVVWPDRRFQVMRDLAADATVTVAQDGASGRYDFTTARPALFSDVTAGAGVDVVHRENDFLDTSREPLMPHLISMEGPGLAVGDVNGDTLDDLYIGGAKWQSGSLYLQERTGRFRRASDRAFRQDSLQEDVDAAFLDADNDGDLDLYVVSGGNEFWEPHSALRDRLYVNDGRGNFTRDTTAIPAFFENGSVVEAADFNGDGFVDVFVGSRVVARKYGLTPRSHLLQNDGNGRFLDVTLTAAPVLAEAGMVTDAAWVDVNGDGALDLVVVGEWMPVRVFMQEGGRFVDRTRESGLAGTNGWWNSVAAADLDGDRRPDLVLGNLGLNSYVTASREEPARLYVGDFGHNGTLEQILTVYRHGVSYPMAGRDELVRAIPQLRSRYPTYASFGGSRVEDIFTRGELSEARVLEATDFASAVALSSGDGRFTLRPLPTEAQLAPVYASAIGDFDRDGSTDIVVAGNFYGVTPIRGRYDASYGLLLRGRGDGTFAPVDAQDSGIAIEGQVRDIKTLRRADGSVVVAIARNNGTMQFLRPR